MIAVPWQMQTGVHCECSGSLTSDASEAAENIRGLNCVIALEVIKNKQWLQRVAMMLLISVPCFSCQIPVIDTSVLQGTGCSMTTITSDISPVTDVHGNIRARHGEGLCLSGKSGQSVQYLHGSGIWKTVSLWEEVWDPFQLQSHVLFVLHPAVEMCQAVRESHHKVSLC